MLQSEKGVERGFQIRGENNMALQQVKDVGNTSHSHRHPFHRFVSSLGLHLGNFLGKHWADSIPSSLPGHPGRAGSRYTRVTWPTWLQGTD